MLSMNVCKRCRNRISPDALYQWTEDSTKLWILSRVVCPFGDPYISIKDSPPKRCPYDLEHALAAGVENAE